MLTEKEQRRIDFFSGRIPEEIDYFCANVGLSPGAPPDMLDEYISLNPEWPYEAMQIPSTTRTKSEKRIGFGPDVSTEPMGKLVASDEYGEWRTVPGFPEDKVIVSSLGWIKVSSRGTSLDTARIDKGRFMEDSHRHSVMILKANYMIYQLVCRAFNGPQPTTSHTVDHSDNNPKNNRACNLAWKTKKEQVDNRRPLKRKRNSTPIIARSVTDNGSDKFYNSMQEASRDLSVYSADISRSIRNKHEIGGYIFEYDFDRLEPANIPGEKWYPCLDDREKILISDIGRIQKKFRNTWQPAYTPVPNEQHAYAVVKVNAVERKLHHLVFEAVHKRKIHTGMVIDHIDSNKSNNVISNLQEITQSENNKKAIRKHKSLSHMRLKHPILCWDVETKLDNNRRQYDSMVDACRIENVCRQSLQSAFKQQNQNPVLLNGRYWKKVFSTHEPTQSN